MVGRLFTPPCISSGARLHFHASLLCSQRCPQAIPRISAGRQCEQRSYHAWPRRRTKHGAGGRVIVSPTTTPYRSLLLMAGQLSANAWAIRRPSSSPPRVPKFPADPSSSGPPQPRAASDPFPLLQYWGFGPKNHSGQCLHGGDMLRSSLAMRASASSRRARARGHAVPARAPLSAASILRGSCTARGERLPQLHS